MHISLFFLLSLTPLVTLSVFSMKNSPFSVVSLSQFIINTPLFSLFRLWNTPDYPHHCLFLPSSLGFDNEGHELVFIFFFFCVWPQLLLLTCVSSASLCSNNTVMGIRERGSFSLKPLEVHKPNHKSVKSQQCRKGYRLWQVCLQRGFGNILMKLVREPLIVLTTINKV